MKHNECKHRVQAINSRAFATVGGWHENKKLSYCEEYLTEDDKWNSLPPLCNERSSPGSVFLNERFLYAVGGANTVNSVEVLDFSEKVLWKTILLEGRVINFASNVMAIPASNSEILVLKASEKMEVGLLSLDFNVVFELPGLKLRDEYVCNQAIVIDKSTYIFGSNGHMHILDMNTRKFEELEYANIYSI
eukprot:TRINITY_DN2609_c0_g1_i1.p1 TRINITY_DN2609_c0_g1~~TRINITY_DN2609_c0_g1_i1.p1  ORF type:complete len:191 (-),score=10.80 TRINITY_DN2609_c0_g1_i1:41-613(-)